MPVVGAQEVETQVVVVGGGPGGYAAAFRAADLGKQVVLVERRDHLGGVCLLEGCVPSKALISAAELRNAIHHAAEIGIVAEQVAVHMEKLARWRDDLLLQLAKGIEGLAKRRKIQCLCGAAYLVEPHRLHLADCEVTDVVFEHLVIATGSRPAYPESLKPDGQHVLTSREALALTQIPQRLLVIGGGYIGLELGSCWRMLGSEVTLVEMTDALLPGADRDLVDVVARCLNADGVTVHLQTQVAALQPTAAGVQATFQSAASPATTHQFDKVLVAVGRRPNTDDFGLDRVGIITDADGFIPINEQCRTSVQHIWAVGDCTPGPMLAHKARRQGIVAAEAIAGRPAVFDNRVVPAVIFSHPEIAYCGVSEQAARDSGREIRVGRCWFRGNPRALTLHQSEGFLKVIADARSQEILGVRIVGPGASELIAEAVLAIEMGAVLEDLMATIHAHPTLAETLHEAAEATLGQALHFFDPRPRR